MKIMEGVRDALASLRSAEFLNIVVTNQPDVASGKLKVETIEAMHRRLKNELALDDIKVCCHSDADGCECRKPKPGMLLQAAGCANFFIDYGYREKRPDPPYMAVKSLAEASSRILGEFTGKTRTKR